MEAVLDQNKSFEDRVGSLEAENAFLKEENASLRKQLKADSGLS